MKNKNSLHSQNESIEKRIMIVDDNPDFAESLFDLLGLHGYVVKTAYNEKDACKKIQDYGAHLALIDIRLGRSNGISLIPKFKSINPDILCVMITAYADIDTSILSLKEGAYDYLQKPFETSDLLATIDRCFNKLGLEAEKAAALRALRESEEKYHSLIANIPSVTWITNSKGETTFISPNVEKIYGYTPEEIHEAGESLWFGRIHPDDVEMVKETYGCLFKKTSQFDVEYRIKRKDGEWIWIHDRAVTTYEKEGVQFAYGVFSDITERKKTENALRESEAKFRKLSLEFHALLDAIDEPLILLSPELKILWANRGAETVFGKSISDINGQLCYKLWFNNSTPCEGCPSLKCFCTGEVGSTQFSASDNRLWDVKVFPVKDEKHKVSNVIIIASDITEEKALQEESMRATQLAAVGELAAGVAHEINNPIYGITMCANLLLEESKYGKIKDYHMLEMILKETNRVANVTRCLLSLAREPGDDKSLCNINEIMSDTLTITRAIMQKEGINLKVQIPKGLPEVIAYPQRLHQVFLNVLYNARYALNERYPDTHKNKIIEIIGKEIMIDGYSHTQIIFYDRGMGIPPDKIDNVLNPFFTTKPRGKGTGLGLSISNKIIKDHNGKLEIDSTEGKFTKVVISFPSTENSH
jgi:PAS domain S-box-containing protein